LCQARFDCAALDFDDGDCDVPSSGSQCPTGQVEDCSGACVVSTLVGDGTCQHNLDRVAHDWDDGDCATSGACPVGTVDDCLGGCTDEAWLGDLYCDAELDCAALND